MSKKKIVTTLSDEELNELRWAYRHLEHPSLAARLSAVLAVPIEEGIKLLPKTWQKRLDKVAQASICRALRPGTFPVLSGIPPTTSNLAHKLLAAGSGAVGGFFGPLTLLAELPFTTVLMLHAIADAARREGEDLQSPETRLACAQVFALGGRTEEDNDAVLGYYALRATLGLHFERDILEFAAGGTGPHIPATIDIVRAIAARFGVVVSDHAAARAIPIAGAASGAALNLIFMNHYQDVAKGHFIVRRLERDHGIDTIRKHYQNLETEERAQEAQGYSPVVGW